MNRRLVEGKAEITLPPTSGRWRVRASFRQTLARSSSVSDWIQFRVGPNVAADSSAKAPGKTKAACVPGADATFAVGKATIRCTAPSGGAAAAPKASDPADAIDVLSDRLGKIPALKDPFKSQLLDALASARDAIGDEAYADARDSIDEFVASLDAAPQAQLTGAERSELKAAAAKIRAGLVESKSPTA
jgi:hypothetical protein